MILSNPVLDGLSVRYDLKKPFAVLAEMKHSEDWCTLVVDYRTAVLEWVA